MQKLDNYLKNKPIFYKKIDYARFPRAFETVKEHLGLKNVVQVVGTNGKGSTGRFLAQILETTGAKVGHYTSPHIFKFNERFYLNGRDATDTELENAHEVLQEILSDEFKTSLSYFEYATLLAGILFKECDYCIFEAGMGAEFDATSQFNKKLSLFTPIGTDHIPMLGSNLEEISRTKLINMAKNAILNDDMNEVSVKIAKQIAEKNGANLKFANEFLSKFDKNEIQKYIEKQGYADFQISNLTLAYAGAKFFDKNINLANLEKLKMHGRLEKITPNLIIDVGHNELAAEAILKEFAGQKVVLIYNAFADKDIGGENYNASLTTAKLAYRQFVSPELDTVLQQSGLQYHKDLIKMFKSVGEMMQNDTLKGGKNPQGNTGNKAEEIADRMFQSMK